LNEPRIDLFQSQQEIAEVIKPAIDAFGESAFEVLPVWVSESPFCYGLAIGAEMTMVMECPSVILRIGGVCCTQAPQRPCPSTADRSDIASCSDAVADGGYLSALDLVIDPLLPIKDGDTIYYQTLYGSTHLATLTSYDALTGEATLQFADAAVTCATGGGVGYIAFEATCDIFWKYIKACDTVAGDPLILTFDMGNNNGNFLGQIGDIAQVVSALKSTSHIGTITNIDAADIHNVAITIDLEGVVPDSCNWDEPVGADPISLAAGGTVYVRICPA